MKKNSKPLVILLALAASLTITACSRKQAGTWAMVRCSFPSSPAA